MIQLISFPRLTVGELVKQLLELDQSMPVAIAQDEDGDCFTQISEVSILDYDNSGEERAIIWPDDGGWYPEDPDAN